MGKPVKVSSSFNWALWVGLAFVLLVTLLATLGPAFAPVDPLKENFIGRTGNRFIKPPFAPNQVEGFPLGSDEWGRDLLSRLLWAVRPTLILVLVVAGLRLAIGILFGLISGWSNRSWARILDGLISFGLSAPVLFVALCVIAAIGNEWGVWAFIAGLSLTGWAEAARVVREQTRSLRGQAFVEAARGMGATPEQLILSHILPHVLPLMWIQLAFEVSGTLLATASLGFLGYFINAVWIPIGDWTGLRASGYPELGQMLGSATTQNVPWAALFAGGMVVFIVLAFNLLGEGLRIQLSPERQRRRSDFSRGSVMAGAWIEDKVYGAASKTSGFVSANGIVIILGLLIVGGVWFIWRGQNNPQQQSVVKVPGEHWWASEEHDAQGTLWAPVVGPNQPKALWTFHTGAGFPGGPVVDSSGNVYAASMDGFLYAVSPMDVLLWKAKLPALPVGTPALAPNGDVLVVDDEGQISSYGLGGKQNWRSKLNDPGEPLIGPVVGSDGAAYYPTKTRLISVYKSGKLRWMINLPVYSITYPLPRLSVDEKYLFFEDVVIEAATGATDYPETPPPMDKYFVGANGLIYLRSGNGMDEWQPGENGYVLIKQAQLDTNILALSFRRPQESGVSPGGNIWILFASGFDIPRFIWADSHGQNPQTIDFPYVTGRMIGIDQAGRLILCGDQGQSFTSGEAKAECRAVAVSNGVVDWTIELTKGGAIVGGAIIPGRLYVTSNDGYLTAIGNQSEQAVSEPSEVAPTPCEGIAPGCTGNQNIFLPSIIH
jgi:ABC-type dipeptide/oligopeptide/nickel transport system permease subunit/outer membrane protein assembly factor BamB